MRLKPQLQKVLERVGLHDRLRSSPIYDIYWRIVDQRRIDSRRREVRFYQSLLDGFCKGDLIFDIGANVGEKTDVFLRLGARVLAVEPVDGNQEVLKEKFLKYRFVPKPVVIVGEAVSDRDAVETMWIDGAGSALNTLSRKWVETLRDDKKRFENTADRLEFAQTKQVKTITLEQLIVEHGSPFFIKIDVEGYELKVLQGLRRPVPYLSFEVNLPEFRREGLECIGLLDCLVSGGKFNYTVDSQQGLALQEWIGAREFSRVFEDCPDRSVEVFWKYSPMHRGSRA